MFTNFLLLIILPLCGNRVGLHTGLSKHLIICTAFNIQMNSKIFLCLEHQEMLTRLIFAPVKCFSGSEKNYQLDVWKQWFSFCLPLIFLVMIMGTLIQFCNRKIIIQFETFWICFFFWFLNRLPEKYIDNAEGIAVIHDYFFIFSSKKCLIHLSPFRINWHV